MISTVYELTEIQTDVLREIANIGSGHAVTALVELTGRDFNMTIPAVGVNELDRFESVVGDMEAVAAAVYMPVEGDVCGHVAFIYPFESATALADMLLYRESGETVELGEMELSMLNEVGNIMVSSFLNAISDMTGLRIPIGVPGVAVDMIGAIFSTIKSVSIAMGDHAFSIRTYLANADRPLEGIFVFVPDPGSLAVLFNSLGIEN